MLRADRDFEDRRRGWEAQGEVVRHLLRVVEFVRYGFVVDDGYVGVLGVGFVDQRNCCLVVFAGHCESREFFKGKRGYRAVEFEREHRLMELGQGMRLFIFNSSDKESIRI